MDQRIYTVITGDVVNSAELEDYGTSLEKTFSQFEEDYYDKLPLKVDRYSGDQFQVVLEGYKLSLRASLYIYTKLYSLEVPVSVRMSISIGEIKDLPEGRVSMGEGEVFRLSGSNLDEMKKHQRMDFVGAGDITGQNAAKLLRGSMDLLSAILMRLSPAQAEVIWYKLKGHTQKEIAGKTGRKQQSVSDILIAGQWKNIKGFLETFEETFENF